MKTKKTKKSVNMETVAEFKIASFMTNVNKLDEFVHRQTHNKDFGTVRLVTPAWEAKNGKRKFAVSKSPVIRNGTYTLGGLRKALLEACN